MSNQQDLTAGNFSDWLYNTRTALLGELGVDVPCGDCNACCRSSYFIHIKPEEKETLQQIPAELLFAAPGLPAGNVLMGYNEKGHCPMLVDEKCSIYEHRPQTCQTYDCRVFPATGIEADENEKRLISRQAQRWKFSYSSGEAQILQEAVQSTAAFIQKQADDFPVDTIPRNKTQLAVMVIKAYPAFMKQTTLSDHRADTREIVQAILEKNKQ